MNDTPTSGPINASMTHHAREASSSRHSLSRSQRNAGLRKRKESVFERGRIRRRRRIRRNGRAGARDELLERPFGGDTAAADQDEAVAHARRVGDLVDRQEHRAAARGGAGGARGGPAAP